VRHNICIITIPPELYTSPQNYKELFNLRHASLRNVIERLFGVMKRKFPLPANQPEFDSKTQAKLISATACIFNFVRKNAPGTLSLSRSELDALDSTDDISFLARVRGNIQDSELFDVPAMQDPNDAAALELLGDFHVDHLSAEERALAGERRDTIAMAMWRDYIAIVGVQE
jgi:hypothetical protein